jgi:hypothetical protein
LASAPSRIPSITRPSEKVTFTLPPSPAWGGSPGASMKKIAFKSAR